MWYVATSKVNRDEKRTISSVLRSRVYNDPSSAVSRKLSSATRRDEIYRLRVVALGVSAANRHARGVVIK